MGNSRPWNDLTAIVTARVIPAGGSRRKAVLLSLLAFFLCQPILAQERQGGEEGAAPARDTEFTVSFGKVNGQPGTDVSMAILFARKPGAPNVAKLRARVSYSNAVLKFNRIEDAYLSRRAKLRVQAKEETGSGAENVLEMNFELADPEGANFPSGQIATVYFHVAADAADQIVPMNPQAWIDEKQVMPDSLQAQIEPGHVRISQTPVFLSCFFFTH